jgi:protein-tyrosine phosphatase
MSIRATNIVDGLIWLGSKNDAANESFLRENNIQCVINVAEELENPGVAVEQYYKFPAQDAMDYPILETFSPHVTQALAECMALNKPALIHCAAGINRSATLLADFLAKATGIAVEEIIIWIRSLRPITFSNPSFVEQLRRAHMR